MERRIWVLIAMAAFITRQLQAQTGLRGVKTGFSNEVSITVEGDYRVIRSNSIPDHPTGRFPGPGNPNTVSPQRYAFRVPANPKPADKTTPLVLGKFGIAVNGVAFDPGADEWWNGDRSSGWQYEPLMMAPLYLGTDASHAHVQPNGAYHYHGIPTALVYALTDGKPKMVIVGWAADGFPIYNNVGLVNATVATSALKTLKSSYRVKAGVRQGGPGGKYDGRFVADYEYVAGAGDLDECNGVFGVTPDYPQGIYHYVLTEQFPYIPRMFRGKPDASFRGPGGQGGPDGRRGGGPGAGGAPGVGGVPGRGGPGGGAGGGFHLIPPFAEEQLNLTEEQQKKIAPIEEEARQKVESILTAEQMEKLTASRPPRGGPGGNRGAGGAGGTRDGSGRSPHGGVHLIPPFAEAQLNLSDLQKKQISDAEEEASVKLSGVLSAEQTKTLEDARPPAGGPPAGGRAGE